MHPLLKGTLCTLVNALYKMMLVMQVYVRMHTTDIQHVHRMCVYSCKIVVKNQITASCALTPLHGPMSSIASGEKAAWLSFEKNLNHHPAELMLMKCIQQSCQECIRYVQQMNMNNKHVDSASAWRCCRRFAAMQSMALHTTCIHPSHKCASC